MWPGNRWHARYVAIVVMTSMRVAYRVIVLHVHGQSTWADSTADMPISSGPVDMPIGIPGHLQGKDLNSRTLWMLQFRRRLESVVERFSFLCRFDRRWGRLVFFIRVQGEVNHVARGLRW